MGSCSTCHQLHPQGDCPQTLNFVVDGNYLVPRWGSKPLSYVDLSEIVKNSETNTRLQLDSALRSLVYNGERATNGDASPDTVPVQSIAALLSLRDISDVNYGYATDGDILAYNTELSAWTSYTIPTGTAVSAVGIDGDGKLVKGPLSGGGGGGTGIEIPIGGSIEWDAPINAIPVNFKLANGQALSRTVYAEYFALIGTMYGSGDGTTTFNMPNKNGRASFGYNPSDTQFNVVGQTGGAKTHSHTANINTNAISRTETSGDYPNHTHSGIVRGVAASDGRSNSHFHEFNHVHSTPAGGSASSLPPYIVSPKIVRVI